MDSDQAEDNPKTVAIMLPVVGDGVVKWGEDFVYIRTESVSGEDELLRWWLQTAYDDYVRTVPKTGEYGGGGQGSADLQVMGDALGVLSDNSGATAQELACWFYALGKISRLISNYKMGKPGKTDTWLDLTVYSLMARRIQEVGQWP